MPRSFLKNFSALVIDGEADRAGLFCERLTAAGLGSGNCSHPDVAALADSINGGKPHLIFLRIAGAAAENEPVFTRIRKAASPIPLILLCEQKDCGTALELLANGAQDFITTDASDIELTKTVLLALRNSSTAEALRKSNERYELVSKATNDMVWDWDLLNNRVYRSPEGWIKVFGERDREKSKMLDGWWDRVHPDDKEISNRIIEEVMQDPARQYFEIECRVLRNTGEYLNVVDRGYVVRDANGNVVRLIGATQNITERKHVEKRLAEERRQRQIEITGAVINAQEQEREAIGKELHDNINQILAATKLYIEYALANAEKRNDLLTTAKGFVESAVKEIRNLSRSLAPAPGGKQGLSASLQDLVRTLKPVSVFEIRCNIRIPDEAAINEGLSLTVYRIMQEALTNITRHANAKHVMLEVIQYPTHLSAVLTDDGVGFDTEAKSLGLGLRNMESRAELHNGSIQIESAPGKGTVLKLRFDMQEN